MNINIIATGVGSEKNLTLECSLMIKSAEVIIGANRIVDCFENENCLKFFEVNSDKIVEIINKHSDKNIVVAMSGDVGFYSGAKKLCEKIPEAKLYAGVSSLQYMAAKIKTPWEDVALFSAHGKNCNVVGAVLSSKQCFFLTGGILNVKTIIEMLDSAGLGDATVHIGENLSYDNEKISTGFVKDFLNQQFNELAVIWICRNEIFRDNKSYLKDSDVIREKVPMTKQEVRSVICNYFNVKNDEVFYDVGGGTGSISLEMAIKNPRLYIKTIEIKEDAFNLINKNREKFNCYNIDSFLGEATGIISELDAPNHVFIGGSKGNLKKIIELILEKNDQANILVSAITLETIAEVTNIFNELFEDFDVFQIVVSSSKKVGRYNMMIGENPIYLFGRRI